MAGIDEYTKLLLHCTGENNSTDFPDSSDSAHTVSVYGDAKVTTAVNDPWGGSTGVMTLDGNDYCDMADSADWAMGSGDFCIDFRMRTSDSGTNMIIGQCNSTGTASTRAWGAWVISGKLYFMLTSGTTDYQAISNGTINNSAWHHVAGVRLGNTMYLFVDGVLQSTSANVTGVTANDSANLLAIGRRGESNGYYFPGQLAEVRISKGTARINQAGDPLYISSGTPADGFTPPAGRYSLPIFYAACASRHAARARVQTVCASRFASLRDLYFSAAASLHSARSRASAAAASRHSARAAVAAACQSLHAARETMFSVVPSRHDSREVVAAVCQSAHHALAKTGWRLYARDAATGAETALGFVDAESAETKLSGVALADGTWEIEARPAGRFWDECRTRQILTAKISGGEIETSGLPAVRNLRSSVLNGRTYLRWNVLAEFAPPALDFGVWLSETSPVDTSGEPDHLAGYYPGVNAYTLRLTQTGPLYAAVAPLTETEKGLASELLLPWSTPDAVTLLSPASQLASRH